MKKQRIKPNFFSLRVEDYFMLRDYGLRNQDLNILATNPKEFFRNFGRYTKEVPDELKSLVYSLCFQIATNPNRNKIESLVYRRPKRKEVERV